jgi:signal transduction histidine kinase
MDVNATKNRCDSSARWIAPPFRLGNLAFALVLGAAAPSSGALPAQRLVPISTFSVGDGLPSALVYDLAQDASGRIWILNREGIVSYDGASFESQGIQRGLAATQCGGLTVDDQGRALAAAFDGRVFRNLGGVWQLVTPPIRERFPGQVISLAQAIQAGREKFLAATTNGLWLWADGWWRRVDMEGTRGANSAVTLSRFGEELAVGSDSGLCRLRDHALDCAWGHDARLRDPIIALKSAVIGGQPSLLVLSHGWLGVLTDGGLRLLGRRLDSSLSLRYAAREGLPQATAAINIDATGAVFFGTAYRAYVLEPGESEPREFGSAQGLLGDGATSILADREGAIWIGNLRGLNRVGSRRFQSMNAQSGLAENEVTAIAELPGGNFLLGHNIGLTFLDGRLGRVEVHDFLKSAQKLPPGIPRILDLAVDSSGTVWAAASVALLEIGRDRHIEIHRLPDRAVSVEFDRRGRLWVLGSKTLFVRQGARFEEVSLGLPKDGPPIGGRWLAHDNHDRLFVTTNSGLFWRDGIDTPDLDLKTPWRRSLSPDGRGDNVYSVAPSADGSTLVGTGGGLYRLAGAALQEVTGPMALSRPTYFLLHDRSGKLWAGTDDGVFAAEPGGFRQLTVRHGLAGRETNRGAGLVDSTGRLWIGTDQGLSIYREALDLRPTLPPEVEIQGLDVEGEPRATGEALDLSGSPRSIVFLARTISFSPEEQAVCRYRLDGLEEEWQGPAPLTTAGVRYTNLPPGRYRLKIAAAWGARGPWGRESVSPELRIPTPWWRRPGVWILSILALGTLLWSGHHLRLRSLGLRNAQLQSFNEQLRLSVAERQRLIAELEAKNSELEQFTYTVSHDLKAPLVTIGGFTSLMEKDAREGRIDQVTADIRRVRKAAETMRQLLEQLLDLSRIGRVVGTRESVPLTPLVLAAAQRVPGIEAAHLGVAPDLPTVSGDRTRLLEVFENLLGNAVKFSASQAAPRIEVSRREGPEPVIVVSDNGIGIDPRFKEKVFDLFERLDKRFEGTGIGLAIVKRIVEFHGGRIWVESTGVQGEGSRFCLTLPQAPADPPGSR